MKLRFYPIIESITSVQSLSDNSIFERAMRWLSPDKSVPLQEKIVRNDGKTRDYYWGPTNEFLSIPNWKVGTERRNNYEKAIRNLRRLINEKPVITHFIISDTATNSTYEKLTGTDFEEYEWDFEKLDK
jgi:hypothetical protein